MLMLIFQVQGTIDVSSESGSVDILVTAEDETTTETYTINYVHVAAGTASTYVQSTDALGLVDINTENYAASIVGEQFDAWSVQSDETTGFYGDAYVLAPNVQNYTDHTLVPTNAPKLEYSVEFTQTGTHYVWAHVYFPDDTGDSFCMV